MANRIINSLKVWHSYGAKEWDWDVCIVPGENCPLPQPDTRSCLNTAQEHSCEFFVGLAELENLPNRVVACSLEDDYAQVG